LARDRWSYLALQAQTKGLLQFDSKSRQDDRWKLKEALVLEVVERDNLAKLHELLHLSEVTAVGSAGGPNSKHHMDAADKQYKRIVELLCPYMDTSSTNSVCSEELLLSAWEEVYGKMDDPETIAGIERTIQSLTSCGVTNG